VHYVTRVEYASNHTLRLCFEDDSVKMVDLESHLEGEIFEPLKDPAIFRTAHLNQDIDTVVWDNGADMSPDFLYEIGVPENSAAVCKVAEERTTYGHET